MTVPRCISRFPEPLLLAALTCALLCPSRLHAQACCAGAAALTPGRLAPHEDALLGLQLRTAFVPGTFDAHGAYVSAPAHASELDLEQDLFGALRLTRHAQLALLVPVLETRRQDRNGSELGAGFGDVNFSGRYDFYSAGRSRYLPGIALLAGVTFPTGTPVERATGRLATDATGLGVVQGNVGIAFEQVYDRWLVGLTGLAALRASHRVGVVSETLSPQWTGIAALAYSFENAASLGLSVAYSAEGRATINGMTQADTARRHTALTLSGLWPLGNRWHLQGYLQWDPPIDTLGKNQPDNPGIGVALIHAW